MEKNMGTTIVYWGLFGATLKNDGKESGNYYLGFRVEGSWKRSWGLP